MGRQSTADYVHVREYYTGGISFVAGQHEQCERFLENLFAGSGVVGKHGSEDVVKANKSRYHMIYGDSVDITDLWKLVPGREQEYVYYVGRGRNRRMVSRMVPWAVPWADVKVAHIQGSRVPTHNALQLAIARVIFQWEQNRLVVRCKAAADLEMIDGVLNGVDWYES